MLNSKGIGSQGDQAVGHPPFEALNGGMNPDQGGDPEGNDQNGQNCPGDVAPNGGKRLPDVLYESHLTGLKIED